MEKEAQTIREYYILKNELARLMKENPRDGEKILTVQTSMAKIENITSPYMKLNTK